MWKLSISTNMYKRGEDMKSWYVEYLIMNRFEIYKNPEDDLDTYEDLLEVLRATKKLKESKLFLDKEYEVLEAVPSISSCAKVLGIHRDRVKRLLDSACGRIAEYLGDYFTDIGFIDYMENKYNLSYIDKELLQKYMNSKFRFKIMRKQYNAK